MTSHERIAVTRLVIMCAAWALGEAAVVVLGAPGLGFAVPALLAAAAFVATRDMGWGGGSDTTYWRGRPIDRDRWRR